ncbi:MAG: methyltransferase domain-containing protein [Burkholderiales bacterium]|jgi:SAM-dependent methyltransferase|nr:methyltransferase domain-containing protein [Burkholderiales bacterium]
MILVNFGSGPYPLAGWINVDLDPAGRPDVVADLSRTLPFADACADAIFSEDFVAQLEPDALRGFLSECRRMLKPEGTLRVLTPDLARFARLFLDEPATLVRFWTTAVGVPLPTGTAADVLNLGMKLAGRWQYDVETFSRVASSAGFDVAVSRYGESRHPAMRGIDLRKPDEAVSMYLECVPRGTVSES